MCGMCVVMCSGSGSFGGRFCLFRFSVCSGSMAVCVAGDSVPVGVALVAFVTAAVVVSKVPLAGSFLGVYPKTCVACLGLPLLWLLCLCLH